MKDWRVFKLLTSAVLLSAALSHLPGYCQNPESTSDSPPSLPQLTVKRQLAAAGDLMVAGKYAEAADLYRQLLNLNSRNPDALAGLGLALGRQFKLDAADEQFDRLLKLDPNNAVAHCGKAMVILNRLQSSNETVIKNRTQLLKEAGHECNKALDSDSRVVEAHYLLGRVFKEEGRLDMAAQAFAGAAKLDPKYSNAFAQLGLIKVLQNKLSDASENLKKAIAINSGNSTAHYGMGQVLLRQNKVDGAIAELSVSLYQNRNSAPVHLLLGKAYEQQGNLVAAVREYKEAIAIKPELPACYLSIADVEEARGDIEMAIAELHSGLAILPNEPSLLTRIGNDSLRVDKLDEAIKHFEAAAAANSADAAPLEGLTRALYLKAQKESAGAYIFSDDYSQAQALIARAIALNPNNIQLRLAQMKIRALSGQKPDLGAIALPKSDAERPAYAEALLVQGRFAEAGDQMTRAINSAGNATQLLAVGDLALMIKDLPDAELAYKRAAALPEQAERARRGLDQVGKGREEARQNVTFGNDLAKKHQYDSAIDKLKSSVYGDPFVADTHLYLAQVLEKNANKQALPLREAIAQYKTYLALVPGSDQSKLQNRIAKLEGKAARYERSSPDSPQVSAR